MPDQETITSIGTSVGYLVAGALAAAVAYFFGRPKPPHGHDAVITGVGIELGNREQMERLIAAVEHIAETIGDKNTAGINDRLDELTAIVEQLLADRPRRPPRR